MVLGRGCGFGFGKLGFGFSKYQKYFNDRIYPNPKPMTKPASTTNNQNHPHLLPIGHRVFPLHLVLHGNKKADR